MYHFISICVSIFNFEVFKNGFQMRNISPPHLSPNLQIKMPKCKLRYEMNHWTLFWSEIAAANSRNTIHINSAIFWQIWTKLRSACRAPRHCQPDVIAGRRGRTCCYCHDDTSWNSIKSAIKYLVASLECDTEGRMSCKCLLVCFAVP